MSALESAKEFYREYEVSVGRNIKEMSEGVYKAELPVHGGLALGINDTGSKYVLYKAFVANVWPDQISHIETDRELNEEIQGLNYVQ